MAYADLATIQTTDPGDILTAAWCDQARDNEEFLIDPPACSVYNSGAQSVSDATTTTLTADSEYFDNDSMHSTSVGTSKITAQTAGRYLVFATTQFAADADGVRNLKFRVNGTTEYETMQVPAGSGVSSCIITSIKALTLAAGDYVEPRCRHTAGGALDVTLLEYGATFITR